MGSTYENVFTPIRIKGLEFKNRIQCAPHVANLASEDGFVTRELVEHHRQIAAGGAAVVTIGDSALDPAESRNHSNQVFLHSDLAINGLNSYVEAVEGYGAIASIEVVHCGRFGSYPFTGEMPYGPSPLPAEAELAAARREGRRPVGVREMSHEHIQLTVEKYADAVYRCKRAGFKMVMIHGGHGSNLPSQFLSPRSNRRRDHYGGSLENRARFAVEVLEAVRKKCGDEMIIEYRISGSEHVEGGMKPDETIEFAKMIEDKIDILHVSGGSLPDPSAVFLMCQPCYIDRMYNVHLAEAFKKELKLPIATVGSIINLENAEMILKNGWADFVALVRPFLADPELMRKCAAGAAKNVRPCTRCNYCGGRGFVSYQLRCAVNPVIGRALEFPRGMVQKAAEKKRVAVAGGGPAGMQAAMTLAERGHAVTLYEKSDRLGGALRAASALDFKQDLREYLEWAVRQTEKCGAEIRLNTAVTAALLEKEKPDAVILAVGADPVVPEVKGIDRSNVHWAGDVNLGGCKVGRKVAVIGGGSVGFETAISLGRQGREVTIVEMAGEEGLLSGGGTAPDIPASLFKLARDAGVKIVCHTRLEEVTAGSIRCVNRELEWVELPCDTVVLAAGMTPRNDVIEELRRVIPETEVYIAGDCKNPATLAEAVQAAFTAAVNI